MVCVVLTGIPGECGGEERDGSRGFGAESAEGFSLVILTHGVDDAPSAEVGPESDGRVGGEHDGPVEVSPVP